MEAERGARADDDAGRDPEGERRRPEHAKPARAREPPQASARPRRERRVENLVFPELDH
jgi:hypothetical protein